MPIACWICEPGEQVCSQVGRHPFGGFRFSEIGSKAGGPDYPGQFVLPVHVIENTLRQGFSVEED